MNPLTLVKRIQSINSKEADLGISEEASWHAKYKESAYIFVGGIPFDLTEGDILAVFAQYGEIVDVNLVRDRGTGKSRGFAFLAYEDQRSTILAVDNLNGAQVLGRTIRVDHCSNYKKKEEEDEETWQQKREARGVCRAFQRGECTRGDGCKFSHDEQRAANTGWGHEDKSSKWGHDKFDGSKRKERRFSDQEGLGLGDKSPSSREKGNSRSLESHSRESKERNDKRLRRHDDDEIKLKSRDDHDKKQENRLRKRYEDDEFERKARDNRDRREEKRPKQYDGSSPKSKDDPLRREENRSRENDGYDSRREERKFRRYDDGEYEPRSREDYHMREEKKSRRHGDDEVEPRSRGERDGKEQKGSRRRESGSSLRRDQDQLSSDKWSNPEKDLSSHYRGERDRYQRMSDR
ncbi:zinc finger CCCH domain-containing protein 25 [Carica papaya]|uniref:zinc finger CCCH domain-containing protein 25 n=1 Tax=Carica papaya TaxID=3649 RepID=UPI000B8CDE14|nr:zinc finger CCCH domain-containing protein 25 [Carica papaya]